mgnify:CR=1 FL=1
MGYRSSVASVVYTWEENEWPVLKLFVEENFPKGELTECIEPFNAKGTRRNCVHNFWGYKFVCEDVKWYDNYPFVKDFNKFTQRLCILIDGEGLGIDKKENWAYEFVRIGEELDDVEREGAGDHAFLIDVSRSFHFNI